IHRLLAGQLDAADEALARALGKTADVGPADATVQGPGVTGPATPAREHSTGQSHDPRLLTLEELGAETGIPVALLAAVEREGLLVAREVAGQARYTAEDVAVARAGLCLLELGLPLADVLDLARQHHQAVLVTAERAVALFDAHIRQPLRAARVPDTEAATRLVEAFQALLPATVSLVSHHFRRTLLAVAQDHIERVGDVAEVHAVRAESARWGEDGQAGSGRR
ncbi:MAG: MerR family transcriptional regulator, partial [Acidimicrobiales bacterium]